MPENNTQAIEFLRTRRSHPAMLLKPPVPDRAQLMAILESGARTPDHGKLEPWRYIVLERSAMPRLAALLTERGAQLGKAPSLVEKAAAVFSDANLVVTVVASPDDSAKIPSIEQTLSAGAVCLSVLNSALAAGWGANWVTGFGAHDPVFRQKALGLEDHEFVAGFIHIGTSEKAPPDRPRPDLERITTWLDA